ncbi:post-GPI attachment to proteins factor 6-like isoform X2 [Prorops nasuta]|uniref:post-GPI attachment to proteins factor 6-like isoform X2 n=1 Tax=Prorops nasuta TaxID=863751 RepID=UPI0034CF0EFD
MFLRCIPLTWCNTFFRISIYFIIIFLSGKECSIPEASQEGALRPFKSYSDVTIFHYTVPQEVLRATWQFAAFVDGKDCPEREVHIYLQWGSYPIISIDNATFPKNMYVQNQHMYKISAITSFESKITALLPVYGPQSGDWFVGAYMTYWDEKVQQQGLGHKCHYSIGSVAVWNQANSIQNIFSGSKQILKTKETISFYKVYIPSGTWSFKIQIWGCNFTTSLSHKNQNFCIKSLALKGRSLPVYNHTQPIKIGNITTRDSYTFKEYSPFEDSYYYLMVISESIIEFNVQVTLSDCPIRITPKPTLNKYQNAPTFSTNSSRLNVDDSKHLLPFAKINSSLAKNSVTYNSAKSYLTGNGSNIEDICLPRFKLTRVKHSQSFSSIYLFQGRDWLTPWILLTDSYPIITQFNILSLLDTGGTLNIGVHLEMDKTLSKQLVIVNICIYPGQIPKRTEGKNMCNDDNLSIKLSSFHKHDEFILIPYPQTDTWYISLEASCHMNGHPIVCEMDGILVSLDIQTRKCVFPGNHSCGSHGACLEVHKGFLYYTTCNCYEGYKGWGCTDASSANSETFLVMSTVMLTLKGLVYTSTMLSSSFYHACDQRALNYCIVKYEVLQYSDFFSSILAFWVTLVAMANLPSRFVPLCHMTGVLMIAFGVEWDRKGLPSVLVPLAIGSMIPVGMYIYNCISAKNVIRPKNLTKSSMGFLLAGIGLILYCFIETESNYPYVHSVWHGIMAISLIFLLPHKTPSQKSCLNGSSCSDNGELLNTPGSPVFL